MADAQALLADIDSRLAASLLARVETRLGAPPVPGRKPHADYVPIPSPTNPNRQPPPPIPEIQGLPEKPQPRAFGSVRRGLGRLRQGAGVVGLETGDLSPEEAARVMATGALDIAESPAPPETTRGLEEISKAGTFGEALSAIVENPGAALAVVGESLPMSLPSLVGGAAGSFAGPGGTAAGVGLPSAAVEYAASMMESVQARGVNPGDIKAVAALLVDEEFLAEARERAAKRGVAVGAFDALTGGLAGQLLKNAKGIGSALYRSLGELMIQAGGGAGGEATAQAVTEGGITNPGEVLLEGVAELIPGVGEVGLNVAQASRGQGSSTPTTPAAIEEKILLLTQVVESKIQEKQTQAPATPSPAPPASEPAIETAPAPAPAPPTSTDVQAVSQEAPPAQPSTAPPSAPSMEQPRQVAAPGTPSEQLRAIKAAERPTLPKRPRTGPPLTLAEFLAQKGVQDQTGELKAMDAHRWHQERPFRRKLVRDDGLSPDYAREAAAEAGYLPQDSTVADLYEAMSEDLSGRTVYSEADRSAVEARQAKVDEASFQEENRVQMEQEADRLGLMPKVIERLDDNALAESIAEAMEEQSTPETWAADADTIEEQIDRIVSDDIPGFERAAAEVAPAIDPDQSGIEGAGPEIGAAQAPAPRPEDAAIGLEATEQGQQGVIPGAERIPDRDLAERRMEGRQGSTAAQKPADEGLFDVAGRGQMDLVEQAAAAQKSGAAPSIVAYHGSPHTFDKFTTEQIGTGEGAQAYGHGLYFADKKEVAEYYRHAISYKGIVSEFREALPDNAEVEDVTELLGTGHFTAYQERVIRALAADDWLGFDHPSQAISAAYNELESFDPSPELRDAIKQSGRLYTVSLTPAEDEFLLWDKPLSEQSKRVKAALRENPDLRAFDRIQEQLRGEHQVTMSGGVMYGIVANRLGGARQASEALHKSGIAGFKYLDQQSRNAGDWHITPPGQTIAGDWMVKGTDYNSQGLHFDTEEGAKAALAEKRAENTSNYVIFDENAVEITQMLTFPGPLADLRKQWEGIADQVIDSLAEGKYSPFAKFFGGYPFKDIALGDIPERNRYLTERGLTQGKIYRANEIAKHLADIFRKANVDEQKAVFDFLTTKGADRKALPAKLRGASVAAKSSIKKVSNELVRRGLLSQESRDKYADAYLPRVYLKHLMERGTLGGGGIKISDQGYLKERLDLPQEYREFLGEINDPAFLVTKALSIPARDMAIQDFLRGLLDNPEWVLPKGVVEWTAPGMNKPRKVTPFWLKSEARALRKRAGAMANKDAGNRARAIADDMDAQADTALGDVGTSVPFKYARLPDSQRYGELRGLIVRREIANDLRVSNRIWTGDPTAWDKITEGLKTFNAFWKMVKVPLNPPTQMRNFISNSVLLNISGVPAHSMPGLYVRAFNQIRRNGKFYRIAKKHGVPASTFNAEELQRMQPDIIRAKAGQGGMMGTMYRLAEPITKIGAAAGDIYQFSETVGKLVKIIDAMEREGRSEAEAVQAAQRALFDYSLVPNLVQQLRTQPIGAPFITFYYKAFPAVIRAAIRHPQRLAPYYIIPYLLGDMLLAELKDVDDEDVDKLRKALPKWMQDQGHVYIFPYKDESGRWAFVNYGYFLPWAMHERTARNVMQISGGEYEGSVNDFFSEIGILGGPVPQIISALMTGKDAFTGREIVEKTDPPKVQLWKLLNYAWRMAGPSWLTDRGVVGHVVRSMQDTPNYYGDPPLSLPQAGARAVGVNIYPTDPATSRQRNIRRKLFEIRETTRAGKRAMRNRSNDTEDKADLRTQYREEIDAMILDLQRYRESSTVHPNLR